jgi:hypothetical protein
MRRCPAPGIALKCPVLLVVPNGRGCPVAEPIDEFADHQFAGSARGGAFNEHLLRSEPDGHPAGPTGRDRSSLLDRAQPVTLIFTPLITLRS